MIVIFKRWLALWIATQALLLLPAVAHGQPVDSASAQIGAVQALPYRINAGDQLGIYVWGEERLQREVRVLPDGTFAFPLVGQVVAQGKLPQEIEAMLTESLRGQYRGQVPQVTVAVKEASGLQFSVMGRVKAPGTFSPGRYVNVLEALSMAGGPTEFAKLDSILILRKRGEQLQTIKVRLGSLFRSGSDMSDGERSNISRVETGDTVIVP